MKKRKHVKHKETDSEIMDAITTISRDLVPPQTSIRWFADVITVFSQKFLVLIDSSSAWMFSADPILESLTREFEKTLNRVSTQTTLPLTIVTRNKPPFFLDHKSILQTMLDPFGLKHEPCTEKEQAWLDDVVVPFQKELNKVMANPERMIKKLNQGFKKRYGVGLKTIGKATKAQTLSKSAEEATISSELLDAWMQGDLRDIKKGLELARKAGRSSLQLLLVAGNARVSANTVIGDWIYNEDGSKYAVKELIEKVFDALSETPEEEVDTCLEILRHCWNAFPHKRLQDKSPFETGRGIWL